MVAAGRARNGGVLEIFKRERFQSLLMIIEYRCVWGDEAKDAIVRTRVTGKPQM